MSGSPTWGPPPPAATGRESPIPLRRDHRHIGRASFARRGQGRKRVYNPTTTTRKAKEKPPSTFCARDCHKIVTRFSPHQPCISPSTAAKRPREARSAPFRAVALRHHADGRLTHTRARPIGVRATRSYAANGLAHNGYIPPLQDISLNRVPIWQDASDTLLPNAPNSLRARVADSATCLQCNQAHPFRGACCSCKLQGNVATDFATKIQLQLQVAKRQTPFNSPNAAPENGSFRPKQRISIDLRQTRKAARKNRYKKGIDTIIYLCYTIVAGSSGPERKGNEIKGRTPESYRAN